MAEFHYYYPMQVRYGDLDPQWHVNNAHYLTFFEQARLAYLEHLGLFDGKSFFDLRSIIADVHVAYLAPIEYQQKIKIGVRVARLGNKSLVMECQIEDEESGKLVANSEFVIVTFDYHSQKSVPIPDNWRSIISEFEGIPAGPVQ
ncbi:MAG: acyl-CoA thioesterase [Anaerolineaceae bacterium]|nr:acyl-CoA thioesterase [Anaerolineaceae bacterium]